MIIKFQFKNSKNVTFRRTEGNWWKYMPCWNCNVGKEKKKNNCRTLQKRKSTHKVNNQEKNYKLSYNLHIFLISYSYTPHNIALYDTVSLLRNWEINIMFWTTSLVPQIYTVEQTQFVLRNFHYRDKLKASKQKSLDFHFRNPLPSIPNFAAEHMLTIIIVVSTQQLLPSLLLIALSDMNRSKIKSDK